MDSVSGRYAIYFAPAAGSELERFGATWLGRHSWTEATLSQPRVPGFTSARLREITRSPRHYGFHATLKAPFRLAEGRTVDDLAAAAGQFASLRSAVAAPPLKVTDLDGFIALTPSAPAPALDELAADCVRSFDCFRAPASVEEIARRRQGGLSPRQDSHLRQYGYPFVLDDFRFHMTLTERLGEQERCRLLEFLRDHAMVIESRALAIDAITVFAQESVDRPFMHKSRHELCKRWNVKTATVA